MRFIANLNDALKGCRSSMGFIIIVASKPYRCNSYLLNRIRTYDSTRMAAYRQHEVLYRWRYFYRYRFNHI